MYPEAVATVLTAAHLNRARRSSRPTGPPQATAYKRTYMNMYVQYVGESGIKTQRFGAGCDSGHR